MANFRVFFLLLAWAWTAWATVYNTRFSGVTWDQENWTLTTTKPDPGHYQSRGIVANGYIGINVASLGPFFEVDTPVDGDNINGWPLFDRRQTFATVSGFWDVQPTTNGTNFVWLNQLGGESVISGLPHWSGLIIESGGQVLSASTPTDQISNFNSSFDMKRGLMTWSYTWLLPYSSPLNIAYTLFAHKLNVHQAVVQLSISSVRPTTVTVYDVLNGDAAVRSQYVTTGQQGSTVFSAVHPNGIPNVTAYTYSTTLCEPSSACSAMRKTTDYAHAGTNMTGISQSTSLKLTTDQTVVINKYVGIASSDAIEDPQKVAMDASTQASKMGFKALLESHTKEWHSIMPYDSVDRYLLPNGSIPLDPNIVEQQVLAVSNPFFLLQNTISRNAIAAAGNNTMMNTNSISVGGLGSSTYAGLVFWDAEVWMQPGLVVSFPYAAQQIGNYRSKLLPQAKKNVKENFITSQRDTAFSPQSAVYSWTSGRFGNCTGTGPCFDYEYHINGDIALELMNYYVVTGDTKTFQERFFPVYNSVASVYADLLHFNSSLKGYTLSNATDPDEYANMVDNPGYTMVLIKTILEDANSFRKQFGMSQNTTWSNRAAQVYIPTDKEAQLYLEYTGMNGSISVKQADVVLIDDFLDYPNPYTLSNLDYYAGHQSQNGPGMTYGVFSIIAAEASPSGCSSYTYDLYGSQPYVRGPWFQYSEQLIDDYTLNGGTHPAYPFLTGMGGANRVAIFGYLGLKLHQSSLNVDPTLPPQISNLAYRVFFWQGYPISAIANSTYTVLTRPTKRTPLPEANPKYKDASIPVTIGNSGTVMQLKSDGTPLVLKNRLPHLTKTVPGNIAQCLSGVTSPQSIVPGQFPLSAIDGAVSTKWQPITGNVSSQLTIDLGDAGMKSTIAGFGFDWAQAPPRSYSVYFSNDSSNLKQRKVASSSSVKISNPYVAARAADIVPYMSNTTNVTLSSPVTGARYATLEIRGNQADPFGNGTGASVAEFAIIQGGHKAELRRYYAREA